MLGEKGSTPQDRFKAVLRTIEGRQDEMVARCLSGTVLHAGADKLTAAEDSLATVFAAHSLQYLSDYRGALADWFRAVAVGGHLVVTVPHAFLFDRQLALPSRRDPAARRLYTPRSLLDEVEEALAPNSYRVRYLGDDDGGYDYAAPADDEPAGHADIVLVIEKITPPAWTPGAPVLSKIKGSHPDYGFDPDRTRVEVATRRPRRRILILKLDHLGDFIMGLPALETARRVFADAEITLVVGPWNADLAREAGVADIVVPFDAFPRNSSEEEVDVHARAGLFEAALPGSFDIAIDLRVDHDTRVFLRKAKATLRAGIGARAQFPFLDIFLPIDASRNEPETAHEYELNHHDFNAHASTRRTHFRVESKADAVPAGAAIIWGPYRPLLPGRYILDPYVELAADTGGGTLMIDVALDMQSVVQKMLPSGDGTHLRFDVEKPSTFEFRIWATHDRPSVDFSFFGGRLIRAGANSVLHQAEYMRLLIELVRIRVDEAGMLEDLARV